MLGIGKPKISFDVSAYGKHPAFNDYVSVNIDPPLANALSSWVETGAKLRGNTHESSLIRSFRFWVNGIKKSQVVLGIVKDSSDRLGRTYPLLIMGNAHMKNRNRQWHRIFTRFDPDFRAFEAATAARYEAFNDFETHLLTIRLAPSDSEAKNISTGFSNGMKVWLKKNREKEALSLPVTVLLDRFGSHPVEPTDRGMFKRSIDPPGAVFLGGLPENPMVTLYNRPLKARDFLDLFNGATGNQNNMDNQNQ